MAAREVRESRDAEDTLVVYIHGIGEQKPAPDLKLEWDLALFGSDRGAATRMAYWADVLRPLEPERVRRRFIGEDEDGEVVGSIEAAEVLSEAGISGDDQTARQFVETSLADFDFASGRLAVRGRFLPLPGFAREPISRAFLKRFLADVAAYLFDLDKKTRIRQRLAAQLPTDQSVSLTIVAHSLGTVIALEVLAERDWPLDLVKFVTLGSPLGITEIQDFLEVSPRRRPFEIPAPIQRWHNFADPVDIVAMDKGLAGDFRPRSTDEDAQPVHPIVDEVIVNDHSRQLSGFNPHSAVGYLAHPKVRRSIHESARFDTMARFVVARDVAERLAINQRHPLLIEILEPGYPAFGESPDELRKRETSKRKGGRQSTGSAPGRLPDRIAAARHEIEKMIRAGAEVRGEDAEKAVQSASLDSLRRFVSAHLTPAEIRQLALEHRRFNLYAVWRSTAKRKLITRSRAVLQVDASHESYRAMGRDVTWAVLDTGIRADHPHFAGRIKAIWDCTRRGSPVLIPRDRDIDGHGSHVSGIIAGSGEIEGRSATSMAPEAGLVVYKVLNDRGEGEDAWIIKALDHIAAENENAAELAVHGLNLSLGGPYDSTVYGCGFTPICQELRRLWRSGVLVVVASGNEGQTGVKTTDGEVELNTPMSIGDPANLEDCIAVGSVNTDRPHLYGVSAFSSRGPTSDGRCKPDVVAPGERIWSVNSRFKPDRPGSAYRAESGTSMAAPHVSGLLAAFLSVRREFIGRPDEVKRLLTSTCTDLGRDRNHQGAGVPNLMKMLLNV